MANMTAGRHRGHTPHVDCSALHVEKQYPSMHGFIVSGSSPAPTLHTPREP